MGAIGDNKIVKVVLKTVSSSNGVPGEISNKVVKVNGANKEIGPINRLGTSTIKVRRNNKVTIKDSGPITKIIGKIISSRIPSNIINGMASISSNNKEPTNQRRLPVHLPHLVNKFHENCVHKQYICI